VTLSDNPSPEPEEGREAICGSCHLVYWLAAPHVCDR
jgi:hypothetical protein